MRTSMILAAAAVIAPVFAASAASGPTITKKAKSPIPVEYGYDSALMFMLDTVSQSDPEPSHCLLHTGE